MRICNIRGLEMLGVYGTYTSILVSVRTYPIYLAPISMDSLLRYILRDISIPICIEVHAPEVGREVCSSMYVYMPGVHCTAIHHSFHPYVYEGCVYSIWVRCVCV